MSTRSSTSALCSSATAGTPTSPNLRPCDSRRWSWQRSTWYEDTQRRAGSLLVEASKSSACSSNQHCQQHYDDGYRLRGTPHCAVSRQPVVAVVSVFTAHYCNYLTNSLSFATKRRYIGALVHVGSGVPASRPVANMQESSCLA